MPRAGMTVPSVGGHGPGAVPRSSHDGAPIGRPVIVGPLDDVSGRRQSASRPGRLVLLARYLRELGLEPVLVTRIGDDVRGRRILGRLQGWGLDTSAVQVDPRRPTRTRRHRGNSGAAFANLDPEIAADAITATPAALIFQAASAVTSDATVSALCDIQTATGLPFFVDIDVGDTSREADRPRAVMLGAKWLRIGADRLNPLLRPSGAWPGITIAEAARAIRRRFALDIVVVDDRGLPVLAVSDRQMTTGPEVPCDVESLDSLARDVATAILVAGVTVGLPISTVVTSAACLALAFGLPSGLAARRERAEGRSFQVDHFFEQRRHSDFRR